MLTIFKKNKQVEQVVNTQEVFKMQRRKENHFTQEVVKLIIVNFFNL